MKKVVKVIMIDKKLKESIPKLKLGIVSANVKVSKDNDLLWEEISSCIKNISEIDIEDISSIPQIKALSGRYPKFQTQFTHKY